MRELLGDGYYTDLRSPVAADKMRISWKQPVSDGWCSCPPDFNADWLDFRKWIEWDSAAGSLLENLGRFTRDPELINRLHSSELSQQFLRRWVPENWRKALWLISHRFQPVNVLCLGSALVLFPWTKVCCGAWKDFGFLLRKLSTGEYQKIKKKRFCGCFARLISFQRVNVLGFKVKIGALSLNKKLYGSEYSLWIFYNAWKDF